MSVHSPVQLCLPSASQTLHADCQARKIGSPHTASLQPETQTNTQNKVGQDSSAGKVSDRKAKCNADAAFIPWCGKRFSSLSQLSVQILLLCLSNPSMSLHASTSVCVLKMPKQINSGLQSVINTTQEEQSPPKGFLGYLFLLLQVLFFKGVNKAKCLFIFILTLKIQGEASWAQSMYVGQQTYRQHFLTSVFILFLQKVFILFLQN